MKLSVKLIVAFLSVGLIPLIVASFLALNQASTEMEKKVFDRLSAVRDLKAHELKSYFKNNESQLKSLAQTVAVWETAEKSKLYGLLSAKKHEVESYFATIQSQIITFAQNKMVVDAMAGFSEAYDSYLEEAPVDEATLNNMRSDLRAYYTNDFGSKYEKELDRAAPIDAMLSGMDATTTSLQHAYIAANPHPLGSKETLDAGAKGTYYDALHADIHPVVRSYLNEFGYYDIFLVDSETGNIVYSVYKELDYCTSLLDGPYAKTNFARAFRAANQLDSSEEFVLVDYECYTPSYEAPASFIASPVFREGKRVGVAIFQMPIDRLNDIMTSRAGMGETGEAYLVGPDYLMRSDSYLDPENHTVVASFLNPKLGKADTEAVRRALAGTKGTDLIIDYNGNYVYSAYAPIKYGDFTWSIMVEIDLAEAMNPVLQSGEEYFSQFIKQNDYYDLFLLSPDGYCFYSVALEDDYQTNLLNGPYADSGLGRLVKGVMDSKEFRMEDFSPYAPSGNAAAAFAGAPVMNKGKLDLVVAVQLSSKIVNEILGMRAGLGETGETYLVGSDNRMRSDSYLDPENRSIQASFAGDVANNGVNTPQVSAALAGDSDVVLGDDYRGERVLSSYAPFKFGDTTWAILAEMDEAEAFAAVEEMRNSMIVEALICSIAVLVLGLGIARSVSKPITSASEQLQLASQEIEAASSEGASASQTLAEGASEQAASLEETSSAIEEIHSIISQGADQAHQTSEIAQSASESANDGQTTIKALRTQVDAVVESAKEMEVAMQSIQESSSSISNIIKTIDDIAFQTNILALNAAVEAARAGEAGAGFAVVADEVRSLAGRASEAARQTSVLIEDSVSRSQHGAKVNEAVGANLQHVLAKAGEVDAAFMKITDEVASVASTMAELESSNIEQKDGITQINSSMVSVSDITQQTAASAEEVASASEELNAQAQSLKDVLAGLNRVVYGKNAHLDHEDVDGHVSDEHEAPKRQKSLSLEG
jgi:methyl-accepting chemotaxis protein